MNPVDILLVLILIALGYVLIDARRRGSTPAAPVHPVSLSVAATLASGNNNKIIEWSEDGNHQVVEEIPLDQHHRIGDREKAALCDPSKGVIWWHGGIERGKSV